MKGDPTEELRMFCLVPYNLSEIQKGIQAAHAIAEYSLIPESSFVDWPNFSYRDWATYNKTIIILNGGTSNKGDGKHSQGSMEFHRNFLESFHVPHACFYEPDLNLMLSGIAFVLPSFIFKTYERIKNPDMSKWKELGSWVNSFNLA